MNDRKLASPDDVPAFVLAADLPPASSDSDYCVAVVASLRLELEEWVKEMQRLWALQQNAPDAQNAALALSARADVVSKYEAVRSILREHLKKDINHTRREMDVTDNVSMGSPDDESCPLLRCVCGAQYESWALTLSVYNDGTEPMPCCGRRLYFSNRVRVYEVTK